MLFRARGSRMPKLRKPVGVCRKIMVREEGYPSALSYIFQIGTDTPSDTPILVRGSEESDKAAGIGFASSKPAFDKALSGMRESDVTAARQNYILSGCRLPYDLISDLRELEHFAPPHLGRDFVRISQGWFELTGEAHGPQTSSAIFVEHQHRWSGETLSGLVERRFHRHRRL